MHKRPVDVPIHGNLPGQTAQIPLDRTKAGIVEIKPQMAPFSINNISQVTRPVQWTEHILLKAFEVVEPLEYLLEETVISFREELSTIGGL